MGRDQFSLSYLLSHWPPPAPGGDGSNDNRMNIPNKEEGGLNLIFLDRRDDCGWLTGLLESPVSGDSLHIPVRKVPGDRYLSAEISGASHVDQNGLKVDSARVEYITRVSS